MIESYDFGRIVIGGVTYTNDVLILGDKVQAEWWRKEGHTLHLTDIEKALDSFAPEMVIVGTGYMGMMRVPNETKRYLQNKGIELRVETTRKACELFNSLWKSKRVLAGFHLTC